MGGRPDLRAGPRAGSVRDLPLEPLTAAAFAPFGDVIEVPAGAGGAANDGTAVRYDDVGALELTASDGRPVLSLFRVAPARLPLECGALERHPLSSQAFVPVGGRRFLVVVSGGGEAPEAARARAFLTDGRQGVNYRRATWHHPVLALEAETDFVMVGRADDGRDCEVAPFAGGMIVRIPRISR